MKYKISIIIPIHNIENYIDKTLESIINQSIGYENLEVIMVDDCSSDGTPKIIDSYAAKYDNFIAIHLPENNGLPGKPRNIGLEIASSDFIMFMDHDDLFEEDICEVLFNRITSEDVDIVFCNFRSVFDDGSSHKYISIIKDKKEINVKTVNEDERILKLPPSIWTKIFRKNLILDNSIRFPEGMLAEDLSFYIHTLLKAKGIIYLNNYYGYNYRIRNSDKEKSTIHIRNKKYLHAMISGYKYTLNILKHEKKEVFFPIIFSSHLKYWMICLVTGKITKPEKKEL
ncbi:MAG: glycosyltransferase family 2 protein, partial [Methanobacterium sp.]|nr:glycosyltransferase family 2 protein [Methanobacterium sp.]